MVGEKGLEPSVADKIGEYVKLKGGMELVELLTADEALGSNKSAKAALDDMKLLLQYVDLFAIADKVRSSSKHSLSTIFMKLVFTTQSSARKGKNILSNSASSGLGTDYVNFMCSLLSVIFSDPLFSFHGLLPVLIFFINY